MILTFGKFPIYLSRHIDWFIHEEIWENKESKELAAIPPRGSKRTNPFCKVAWYILL